MRRFVEGKRRNTAFGIASQKRDAIYEKGQGDVAAALQYARAQRELFPKHPEPSFFLGNAIAMLTTEYRSNAGGQEKQATAFYDESEALGFEAWLTGQQLGRQLCREGGTIVKDWQLEAPPGVIMEHVGIHHAYQVSAEVVLTDSMRRIEVFR